MINKNILKHLHKHHKGEISEEELYDAYKIFFGALVSEPRLKIINLLRNNKKTVSEIMQEFKMDQTSTSHNLARLKICGFVKSEVNGKFRYYYLNKETIKPLIEIINKHMSQHCVHILRAMKKNNKMKGGNEHERR